MLQIANFAILYFMGMTDVELNAAARLLRLFTQVIFHHVHIMGYHQKRHVMMLMHMSDQFEEIGLGFGVNPDGRLIQNKQIRMIDHRSGQKSPLLLPARKLPDPFAGDRLDAHHLKRIIALLLLAFADSAEQIFLIVQS